MFHRTTQGQDQDFGSDASRRRVSGKGRSRAGKMPLLCFKCRKGPLPGRRSLSDQVPRVHAASRTPGLGRACAAEGNGRKPGLWNCPADRPCATEMGMGTATHPGGRETRPHLPLAFGAIESMKFCGSSNFIGRICVLANRRAADSEHKEQMRRRQVKIAVQE